MQTKIESENGTAHAGTRNKNLSCWQAGSNPLCLRIELSDGTQFLLPYGYFEGAQYLREGDTDVLHLQFKIHEFVVKGSRLAEIFAAFQRLSVEWMKACPRRFEPLSKEDVFIQQIEIAEPADD